MTSTRIRKTAFTAYIVMICGLLVSCSSGGDPLAAYKNQNLIWQTCPQSVRDYFGDKVVELDKLGARAQCAFMRAPLHSNSECRQVDRCAVAITNMEWRPNIFYEKQPDE
jgi:hypothetical protein